MNMTHVSSVWKRGLQYGNPAEFHGILEMTGARMENYIL